jgi:hypothetical protein
VVADNERFRHLWRQLLNDVAPTLDLGTRYCAAPGIRGSKYEPGGIAIIGRALNGWAFDFKKEDAAADTVGLVDRIVAVHVCTTDKKMIGGKPECGPMHWVEHEYYYLGATRINVKFSKFWRGLAVVIKNRLGPGGCDKWEETIAWTNLYPVSYACGGNPGGKLMNTQRAVSTNLLRLALQEWKPSIALFVTETNSRTRRCLEWSEPFHHALELKVEPVHKGPVLATSTKFGACPGTRALFVARPDARWMGGADFKDWTANVTNAIASPE